jgi:capsular polysaccharide biosynthesis protein
MSRRPTDPDSKAVALSGRLFQRLLAAYPAEHRREYGPAMAQLFRDQCRDAWGDARGRGLIWLWLRVLPDLVKTSVLEHIHTFKERKTMLERLGTLFPPRFVPRRVSVAVFAAVFVLVVVASTLVTFILPESFASTARVLIRQETNEVTRMPGMPTPVGGYDPYFLKTQFAIIQSEAILDKVINDLDLNRAWGRKHAGGNPLSSSETLSLLKARMDVRPIRNTRLIEIRVFSDQPSEAAALANSIAQSYRDYRSRVMPADIVDQAVPGLRPVRPNKPANIVFGAMSGMLLALVAGAAMAGITAWIGHRRGGSGAPPPTGATLPPDLPPAGSRRAKPGLDQVTGMLWMGIGGGLCGLSLLVLIWFLVLRQAEVTAELLVLPIFGVAWGCNTVLGYFLLRGKRWARMYLGAEGVLFLAYYYFRQGAPLPYSPEWVSLVILRLGWFLVGPLPPMLRWVFIALGLASVFALLWPRTNTHPDLAPTGRAHR